MSKYQSSWQVRDNQSVRKFLRTPVKLGHVQALILLGFLVSIVHAPNVFAATEGWTQQPGWTAPSQYSSTYSSASRQNKSPPITPFAPGSNNISIDLGQVFLMGDLSSDYSDNLGFRLSYTYGVSDIFGFEANLGHSSHSNGGFSMSHLNAGLRTNLAWFDRIIPYLSFGLGFYRPGYTFTTTGTNSNEASVSPILFGIHLGPGVNLQLTNRLYFGTSLTFHDIFGTETVKPDGTKLEAGGTFTSLLIHAGMSF
jgi:hypothetical protein